MPQLKQSDLRTPFGGAGAAKVRARIDRVVSNQNNAAATATETQCTDVGGKVQSAHFVSTTTPGAGESLAIDVLRNGVSILTGPLTITAAHAGKTLHRLPLLPNATIAVGDALAVARTYVAGGTPAPLGPNRIVIEVA